jgi:prolyl-tRNA editing enzyme YbaK/EbsC (Cys-tRNA(Pro) deacylase)
VDAEAAMASRVMDYLLGRGVTFTVIPGTMPATGVAKTVVAIDGFGPALLVLPGDRDLDEDRMRIALEDPGARLATPREIERTFPDHEFDALPPLSMLLLAPMYVDPAIAEAAEITFLAGRRDLSIRMATADLFGNDPVVIVSLVAENALPESAA